MAKEGKRDLREGLLWREGTGGKKGREPVCCDCLGSCPPPVLFFRPVSRVLTSAAPDDPSGVLGLASADGHSHQLTDALNIIAVRQNQVNAASHRWSLLRVERGSKGNENN